MDLLQCNFLASASAAACKCFVLKFLSLRLRFLLPYMGLSSCSAWGRHEILQQECKCRIVQTSLWKQGAEGFKMTQGSVKRILKVHSCALAQESILSISSGRWSP